MCQASKECDVRGGRVSTFIHIRTGLFCDSSHTMYDTIIYSYATKVNFLS